MSYSVLDTESYLGIYDHAIINDGLVWHVK
jgi:hypothetical protein